MNRLQLVLGIVASALVGAPAWALPSVYDGFDYANDGGPLEGREGGYGWAGPWVEVGGDLTTFQFYPSESDTSLDMPNLPFEPSGRHVVATGPGSGGNNNYIVRPMTANFSLATDNTFYASYLMQKTGGPGTAANNQEFNLYDGGTVSLRMGSTSTNTFFLGVATNTIPDFTFNYGDTYLVVAKIDATASGTDVASVVIFDASEAIPASEPASFDVSYNFPAARGNDVIDTLRFWIGASAAGMYDELRMGNTWQDVTSIDPNYILGDFDLSGAIDPGDYQTLAANLYTGTTYEQGDINFSGRVDLTDFAIFREIYTAAGFVLPPGAPGVAVPEPATWLALAGVAVVAPLWLRRRKSA